MFRSAFTTFRYIPAPFLRRLSTSVQDAASAPQSISKEALIKLRKRTGYSFVNCRKALVQCGESNLEGAEKWLKEVAIKEGWAKAVKLSDRETGQGVCAVLSENNVAAVIEINCETDFVANNEEFKSLVAHVAYSVLKAGKIAAGSSSYGSGLKVVSIDFSSVQSPQGSPIQESITAAIGKLGENLNVSKTFVVVGSPDVKLFGNAHPKHEVNGVNMGRYVSVVGIRRSEASSNFPTETLGSQICQHIIDLEMAANCEEDPAAEKELTESQGDEGEDHLNAFSKVETVEVDEDEKQLLKQAFMFNPQQSVNQYLATHGAEVIDFRRFELGKEFE
uniref:Elongation factor Ts, mitochondrial n=1 Tax=Ditylenchus dipsaci TaxID=166011 RepID=A0A915CMB6_9BILA